MASPLTTTVTELPESRVRVEAQVTPAELQRRLEQTARSLGRELRVPGFRKGKVPPAVVIGRVGRQAILDEAVRDSLARWYADAVADAGIVPVGDPKVDLGELPAEGEPLTFSIEIGVRPTATLGDYRGLEVGRREPQADDELVDGEIERLRERFARLETVERAAERGDFVVVDFAGTVDGETPEALQGRDEMIELGSGRLAEGMEDALVGAAAGDERSADVDFPDDHPADFLQGRTATFAMTVKEVKHKELPALDDDFASDAAGFDTLEELREDIRAKALEQDEARVDGEFREAVLDAAVERATVTVPAELVDARAREMRDQMLHSLAHQGIDEEAYLRISGKTQEEDLEAARPEAERALRREAVLAAIVEAEEIEPTDQELLASLEAPAKSEGVTPKKLLERLRSAGRVRALAEDVATRRAVDLLAESATPIAAERAAAREQIWTPGDD